MTTEQINQIIHEARGMCWHETAYVFMADTDMEAWVEHPAERYYPACKKCRQHGRHNMNPSYASSWADYGEALEWAMKQHWWCNFVLKSLFDDDGRTKYYSITAVGQFKFLLDPVKGSKLLAEFIVANPQELEEFCRGCSVHAEIDRLRSQNQAIRKAIEPVVGKIIKDFEERLPNMGPVSDEALIGFQGLHFKAGDLLRLAAARREK